MATLELFGTKHCPYTQELREWLEWQRRDFVEYDIDINPDARRRFNQFSGGQRAVPLLIEDEKVVQVGWQGRTCMVEAG